ncbi:hypothetical protein C0J52_16797 [Blattella germanica]|nr:hypothetical protein C0J52_16797 [Blattella germanica]
MRQVSRRNLVPSVPFRWDRYRIIDFGLRHGESICQTTHLELQSLRYTITTKVKIPRLLTACYTHSKRNQENL